MKEQLELLQSFDPAERARGGEQLVQIGLNRCADALLDHVANEFDTQVLAAVAQAVLEAPAEPKESKKVQELRAWAAAERERTALEESFMGEVPAPAGYRFELPSEDDTTGLDPDRDPLPARVPATVAAGEAEAVEYRFDLPPEAEPVDWDADTTFESVQYRAAPAQPTAAQPYETAAPQAQFQPEPEGAPEPAYFADHEPAYAPEPAPAYTSEPGPAYTTEPQPLYPDDLPPPIGAPGRDSSPAVEAPPYIYWRPPVEDDAVIEVNGGDTQPAAADVTDDAQPDDVGDAQPASGEELVDPSWPGIELPTLEPPGVDEPAPGEFRFAGPEPLAPAAEVAPETSPTFEPALAEQPDEHVPVADVYDPPPVESAPVEAPSANPFPEYRFEPPDTEAAPPAVPIDDQTEPAEEAGPPRTLAERLRARNA